RRRSSATGSERVASSRSGSLSISTRPGSHAASATRTACATRRWWWNASRRTPAAIAAGVRDRFPEETRNPVERPDFKSGKGRQPVLGGFDSHSLPPIESRCVMSDVRLTSLTQGGGCGCKIAPAALTEILAKVPRPLLDPALLVGIETSDDAAVYRLNDEQAVVATTDFFMPIVDDPYDFGRIAATNALSDIYAMGARPILALAIVGMPLDKLPVSAIQGILAGGESVCAEAGIPIAGGHSIDTLEPIY